MTCIDVLIKSTDVKNNYEDSIILKLHDTYIMFIILLLF